MLFQLLIKERRFSVNRNSSFGSLIVVPFGCRPSDRVSPAFEVRIPAFGWAALLRCFGALGASSQSSALIPTPSLQAPWAK
jgi:hypothetical protein